MHDDKVTQNMGLVYAAVRRFLGRGAEYDDLVQIGSIGLIKAVNNFDENKGFAFSTYAVPLIIGEIKRHFRDDGLIKISRSIKENAGKIGYAKEKLQKELGRSPTLTEISEETNLKEDVIIEALDAVKPAQSLYERHDEEDCYVIDRIKSNTDESEKTIDSIFLTELLNTLDNRSKKVILLRYFKEETQAQIAQKLGISQVQVSRIEKKVLETLRQRTKEGI